MDRVTWLGRPWFFAAVALLALNDHVFKPIWPGWVTGKLSDFAGLTVVGTIMSVLAGSRLGTMLAGLGYIALKAVPGVAELVAPLLGGGVTLRDPSDLLALAVLPVLGVVLSRGRSGHSERTGRGWQVVGVIAAVLATTATSPPPIELLSDVGWRDGAFIAEVQLADGAGHRALQSTDGGRTWAVRNEVWVDGVERSADGAFTSCTTDSVCYRATDREPPGGHRYQHLRLVERRDPGADWHRDAVLPGEGALAGLAVNPTDGDQAVVQSNDGWVYFRVGPGDWQAVDLIALARGPQWLYQSVLVLGSAYVTLLLGLLLPLVCAWLVSPAGRATGVVVLNIAGFLLAMAWGLLAGFPAFGMFGFHLTWVVIALSVALLIRARTSSRTSVPELGVDE